jgi:DNA polymerase
MTVKFSLDLDQKPNPGACKRCSACGLYLNQLPAFDLHRPADVFWVGLSAVQFGEDDEHLPLSVTTRSGALIELAEQNLKNKFTFYRTNIVKCLPLNQGKIRYPVEREMSKCFPNFQGELESLNPCIVFLLGKQVATFVLKQYGVKTVSFDEDFNFEPILINWTWFVPIHHPSYILVYKRKFIDQYLSAIKRTIMDCPKHLCQGPSDRIPMTA